MIKYEKDLRDLLVRTIGKAAAFAISAAMLAPLIPFGTVASAAETSVPQGSGTVEEPYQIGTAEELYWFAGLVNGTISGTERNTAANAVLTADITVNENVLTADYELNGDGSGFEKWTPIAFYATTATNTYPYTGTFDGNNHTISGLYCVSGGSNFGKGLFGGSEGVIKNVNVVDSYFNCRMNNTGAICGNNRGTVSGCSSRAYVTGTGSNVGGICGYNGNLITGCISNSLVCGSSTWVGGICGNQGIEGSVINNSVNNGNVRATDIYTGGICGALYSSNTSISNCVNNGDVYSKGNHVGGICGILKVSNTSISNCVNNGDVYSKGNYVGGICGYQESASTDPTIYNCANKGTVSSDGSYIGGICGIFRKIYNCYNCGGVSSTKTGTLYIGNIGGMTTDLDSTKFEPPSIKNCYYDSTVCKESAVDTHARKYVSNTSGYSTEEFKTGKVAYLLNENSSEGVWKQTIGSDTYPNFTGLTVYCDSTASPQYYNMKEYTNTVVKKITSNMTKDGSQATAVLSEINLNRKTVQKVSWKYNAYSAEYDKTDISGQGTVYFGIVIPELLEAEENSTIDDLKVTIE
ncbi:MAG: hypothetical protein Q4G33_14460 [bacterium]|nr:hypothetical protein [bacterium]